MHTQGTEGFGCGACCGGLARYICVSNTGQRRPEPLANSARAMVKCSCQARSLEGANAKRAECRGANSTKSRGQARETSLPAQSRGVVHRQFPPKRHRGSLDLAAVRPQRLDQPRCGGQAPPNRRGQERVGCVIELHLNHNGAGPRAITFSDPSGSGRCSVLASSHGAVSHISASAGVVSTTGIALLCTAPTSAFASVVRNP